MPHRTPHQETQVQARVRRNTIPPNAPHWALASGVLLCVVALVFAYLSNNRQSLQTLLALVATTVPSLLAAGYAERASRDIRNGTVTEKARQGTHAALEETGVTEVVEATQRGQTSLLVAQALSQLLADAQRRAEAEDARDARRPLCDECGHPPHAGRCPLCGHRAGVPETGGPS